MTDFLPKFRRAVGSLIFTPRNCLLNMVDPPVVVLLYHRVTTLARDPELLAVTPDHFRAQMRYLKETVHLVRFDQEWGKNRKPAVAVTFDDGYADNALEALPILEEVGVPATFFISTATIGTPGELWWDEVARLVLGEGSRPAAFTCIDTGRNWSTESMQQRQGFYRELVSIMTAAPPERRTDLLSRLREWGAPSTPSEVNRTLSVAELRRLAAGSQVSIGAHTVHHLQLSGLTREEQRKEIESSKRVLEGWLGREITTFSYPYGRRSHYDRESVRLCRELGFTKAASNFPGQAHRWSDPYQIPRHLVRDWPVEEFARRLKGFWTR